MFEFEKLSKEELAFILRSGKNPITGSRIQGKESEPIIQMIELLHAAIYDYDIDIEGHFVYIPGLDTKVDIEESINISGLAKKIYYAFKEITKTSCEKLSKQNIQNAILQFLLKNEYLELRYSPYSSRNKSYYATDKGEDCGIFNTNGKNGKAKHIVSYSCYMQACIVRKLPEILSYAAILQFESSHDMVALCNSVEPLSIDEQELICGFRTLNYANQNLVKQTVETLRATAAQSGKRESN